MLAVAGLLPPRSRVVFDERLNGSSSMSYGGGVGVCVGVSVSVWQCRYISVGVSLSVVHQGVAYVGEGARVCKKRERRGTKKRRDRI